MNRHKQKTRKTANLYIFLDVFHPNLIKLAGHKSSELIRLCQEKKKYITHALLNHFIKSNKQNIVVYLKQPAQKMINVEITNVGMAENILGFEKTATVAPIYLLPIDCNILN